MQLERTLPLYAPRRKPGMFGAVLLIVGVLLAALMLGYVFAVFPPAFSTKLAVMVLGAVLLVWAAAAAQAPDRPHAGRVARFGLCAWAFLLGAVPAYMPFKFGPLPGLHPLRITYAIVFIGGVFALITSASVRARLAAGARSNKAVFALFGGFIVWQLACAFIGDLAIFSLYYVLKVTLPAFLMFIVAVACLRDWNDIHRVARYLLLGVVVACLVGLYEWRTHSNPFLRFLPTDPDEAASLAWIIADKARGGDYRISATFAHPLLLAEYMTIALPLSLMLAAKAPQRWVRLLALGCLPLLLGMIYLSHTRSALISTVASFIVIGTLFGLRAARDRTRPVRAMMGWGAVLASIVVVVGLSGTVAYIAKGRTEAEAGSSQARMLMLQRGNYLLAERPVQGYGPGLGAMKVGRIQPGQRSVTIDSYFLSVAIETGFVGLVLFSMGWAVALGRTGLAAIRQTGMPSWTLIALATAMMASLIVKLALSLTENLDLLYLLGGAAVVARMWTLRDQGTPGAGPAK